MVVAALPMHGFTRRQSSEVFDLKPTSQKQNEEREKRWNRPRRYEAGIPRQHAEVASWC